jgi:sugar phosphate isomerase/epimerase
MFQVPRNATMDDWKKAAQELNVMGEKTKTAGLQMGYHNHHFEFQKINDELIYPVLMDGFDPELIKMQFQVAVVNIGYQAADYFRKYPGRFISAHLTDYAADNETEVPVGQGIVDWDDLFKAAKKGGVQNFFVEMNPDSYEETAKFLLKV